MNGVNKPGAPVGLGSAIYLLPTASLAQYTIVLLHVLMSCTLSGSGRHTLGFFWI